MEAPDLTNLGLQAIVGLLIVLGGLDTIGSMLIALALGTFSGTYATSFLVSHVSKIWFPIFGLGLLGQGIEILGVPAIGLAGLAATGALAAYLVATVVSLKGSFEDRAVAPKAVVATKEVSG